MAIDLEEKSKQLKSLIGKYDSISFLGQISTMMYHISFDQPIESLRGLSSPLRQLYYLANLNITSPIVDDVPQYPLGTREMWNKVKELLNEIENGYEELFYPNEGETVDDIWRHKRQVAMPTFLSYFNMGPLSYDEQVIERVRTYFKPFDNAIQQHFGLNVQDFIDIYNYIDELMHIYMKKTMLPKESDVTWQEFTQEMAAKGIQPDGWQKYLPENFAAIFEFMSDPGKLHRFKKDEISSKFGKAKANAFLNVFTCERQETNFLYYTQASIFQFKPLFKIDDYTYQSIEIKQIIFSIYNTLMKFCINTKEKSEAFYRVRGKELEDKIEKLFKSFLGDNSFAYKSYYTKDKKEQDLLFTTKGLALIVEAKASKRDEPYRNPDMAYPLILENFNEVIQKGYDQSYRVKEKFIYDKQVDIYKDIDLRKLQYSIRTKNVPNVFSIVVTLERFGQIQTDLTGLLEVYDNDEYPWSVCIDDLEVILLFLKKHRFTISDFVKFLSIRERLQGKIITSDELEIFGLIVNDKIKEENFYENAVFMTNPDDSSIFDFSYHTGLGFSSEKRMEIKKEANYISYGDKADWNRALNDFENKRRAKKSFKI